jgi:2'-5' RNA ligase
VGGVAYVAGQTAVVVAVPQAMLVVQPWFGEFDEAAWFGAPPHVTVLFPFLRVEDVDAAVLTGLGAIAAAEPRFAVEFVSCARFPGVLYLEPRPDAPFRRLTAAIAERWPQAQPYGGEFEDPTPHLTVAHTVDPARFDEIEADVRRRLPLRVEVAELQLLAFDGQRWARRNGVALG